METLEDSDEGDLGSPNTTNEKKEEEEEKKTVAIPNEIIFFDILTRLPVKSLLQFRCVSKLWCSRMRDPSFVNQHLTHSVDRPDDFGLFISAYNKRSSERHFLSASLWGGPITYLFTLPNSPSDPCVSVHLNGLFLIHRNGFTRVNSSVHICNPSTREIARLPATDPIPCSPSVQTHVSYNLGFDPSTNQYKVLNIRVVKFRSFERKGRAECGIFTLGTDSWRKIDPVFPFDVLGSDWLYGSEDSVCVNGAIHWLLRRKYVIVAFDLREEKFRKIPLPHAAIPSSYGFTTESTKAYMIQFNGLLAVICHNQVEEQISMEMWVLEDYQNQVWVLGSMIFPSHWAGSDSSYRRGTIHTGEILLTPQRIWDACVSIPFYDLKKGSFRFLVISSFPEWLSADDVEITYAGDYIENILALRSSDPRVPNLVIGEDITGN